MSITPRTVRRARGAVLSQSTGSLDASTHHCAYRAVTIDTAVARHLVRLDGDRPPVG